MRMDSYGVALSLAVRGDAYYGLGRYGDAANEYSSALPVFRELAIRRHQAVCQYKLGLTYQALGRCSHAKHELQTSLELFRHLQLPVYERRTQQALEACAEPFTAEVACLSRIAWLALCDLLVLDSDQVSDCDSE